jgi:RNA polymerase-binding transcription factor DksA
MAVKKKPVKSVKKAPPKKAGKPAAKKPAAVKKPVTSKPAKKDIHKKNVPVSKKTAAKSGSVKSTSKTPAASSKKPATRAAAKKSAPVVHHHTAKPAAHTAPAAKTTGHGSARPAQAGAKPVQQPATKTQGVKADHKPVFKQEVKNTSPVTVKPEFRRPVPEPSRPGKLVIPEIKTKTVRKYEPEFTKSVLDTHQQEQTGPTMRYSDAELMEFKELITRKLEAAKKELAYLQGLITRRDEMGGDETDNRYMTMEDGSMSMEREQLSQMASRQITFIDHLEKAMMRIENKTYGICRVTGKLIDKARLKAVPHATLSIEAKQTMNK